MPGVPLDPSLLLPVLMHCIRVGHASAAMSLLVDCREACIDLNVPLYALPTRLDQQQATDINMNVAGAGVGGAVGGGGVGVGSPVTRYSTVKPADGTIEASVSSTSTTALCIACQHSSPQHAAILQLLLQYEGIDAKRRDGAGNSPMDLAIQHGNFDACEILEQWLSTHDKRPRQRGCWGLISEAVLLDGEDEVNIAAFLPQSGAGLVLGTNKGRVRFVGPGPW